MDIDAFDEYDQFYLPPLHGDINIILGLKNLIKINRKNNSFSRQLVEGQKKQVISFVSVRCRRDFF
jgi:hypothetical protein